MIAAVLYGSVAVISGIRLVFIILSAQARNRELEQYNVDLATESLEARRALNKLTSWTDSIIHDPDFIECRNDEDCDHCLGLQILEECKSKIGVL